jgi:UDP-N-acetyl-D-galactosamine dehydrogenase
VVDLERKICVVGLGYVGLPLAVEFGKTTHVTGYDIDAARIGELKKGQDRSGEVEADAIRKSKVSFTSDPSRIRDSDFIIVAIPTPVDDGKRPDLSMLKDATRTIGRNLSKGSIVVFESTVYPGTTEEICVPILERESGLSLGNGFGVGYSPERINPGDREHTVGKIEKVVSASDKKTLGIISDVYGRIVRAGVYRAPSIKVAEAAKIIENVQRDINIALMNELKMIFDRLGIDTEEVLKAAETKWNFMRFRPGLVGGHCIGIDPYYLAYKAETSGHHPEIILAGRRINDGMPGYTVSRIVDDMISMGKKVKSARVIILGATFKPNVRDLRNSKVEDIVRILSGHGCRVDICDPLVAGKEVFGCRNVPISEAKRNRYDYTVLAVKHDAFRDFGRPDFTV